MFRPSFRDVRGIPSDDALSPGEVEQAKILLVIANGLFRNQRALFTKQQLLGLGPMLHAHIRGGLGNETIDVKSLNKGTLAYLKKLIGGLRVRRSEIPGLKNALESTSIGAGEGIKHLLGLLKKSRLGSEAPPNLAKSDNSAHAVPVHVDEALVEDIKRTASINPRVKALLAQTALSENLQRELVEEIARAAAATRSGAHSSADNIIEPIVDPISGLELPVPAPQVLYSERPANEFGRKPSIEEWLDSPHWKEYKAHCLIAAGDLAEADPSAYRALYKRMLTLSKADTRGQAAVRIEYFLKNGVLAEELMEAPPHDLARQVDLIRRGQARRHALRTLGSPRPEGTEEKSKE